MRQLGYQNACLTVIAVLLGLNLMQRDGGPVLATPAGARQGGQPEAGGLANALDQRKVMIMELRNIGARLERLEGALGRGMDVRVKDMPPVKFPPEVMRRLEVRGESAAPVAAPAAVQVQQSDPAGEAK